MVIGCATTSSQVAPAAAGALRGGAVRAAHRLREPRGSAAGTRARPAAGARRSLRSRRRPRAPGAPAGDREPGARRRRRRPGSAGGDLGSAAVGAAGPGRLPLAQTPTIDLRVLVFAGLLTALTGIGFGSIPALRACRDADLGALRRGRGRAAAGGSGCAPRWSCRGHRLGGAAGLGGPADARALALAGD